MTTECVAKGWWMAFIRNTEGFKFNVINHVFHYEETAARSN